MVTKAIDGNAVMKAQAADTEVGLNLASVKRIGQAMGFDADTIASHYKRLESMVPPSFKAERYIHRQVAGRLDFDRFDLARDTRHNIMMPGPTGAGKTTSVVSYSAQNLQAYSSVEFSGEFIFADVIGSTDWDKDGNPVFHLGDGTLVVLYGGCWDLSDCNLAPGKFTSPMFPVLDHRQSLAIRQARLVIPKHPHTLIFGSYNPGYAGTNRMNEAFINRFGLPIPWGYDAGVEEALVGTYSPTLLQTVRRMRAHDRVNTDIGTNTMEEFITFAQHEKGDIDIAIEAFTYRLPDEEQTIAEEALRAVSHSIAKELGIADAEPETEATADEDDLYDSPAF